MFHDKEIDVITESARWGALRSCPQLSTALGLHNMYYRHSFGSETNRKCRILSPNCPVTVTFPNRRTHAHSRHLPRRRRSAAKRIPLGDEHTRARRPTASAVPDDTLHAAAAAVATPHTFSTRFRVLHTPEHDNGPHPAQSRVRPIVAHRQYRVLDRTPTSDPAAPWHLSNDAPSGGGGRQPPNPWRSPQPPRARSSPKRTAASCANGEPSFACSASKMAIASARWPARISCRPCDSVYESFSTEEAAAVAAFA